MVNILNFIFAEFFVSFVNKRIKSNTKAYNFFIVTQL